MAVQVDSAIVVPILKMLRLETIVVTTMQLDGDERYNVCYRCKHNNVPDNACNQGITADMMDGYCSYCGEKLVDGDGSSKSNPLPFYFLPHRPRTKRVNQTRCRR